MSQKTIANSLTNLILIPATAFVIILSIAIGIVYRGISNRLDEQLDEMQRKAINATVATMAQMRADKEDAISVLNRGYIAFREAVVNADLNGVATTMDRIRNLAKATGFIYIGPTGHVMATSFSDLDQEKLSSVRERAREVGLFSSMGDFLKGKVCDYSATIVKNEAGEEIGVAIITGFITSDIKTLPDAIRHQGVSCFVFDDKKCVLATTQDTSLHVNAASLTLDTAIVNAAIENHYTWKGWTSMLGRSSCMTAVPLTDLDGNTLSTVVSHIDSSTADSIGEFVRWSMPLVITVFAVILTFVVLGIRAKVIKPLHRLEKDLHTVASGDMTVTLDYSKACNEVMSLGDGIEEMAAKIRALVVPIHNTGRKLGKSSDQLALAANELSEQASRQAASLEEISSSMEEMGANIQQNAENSVTTNKLTEEIKEMAQTLAESSKVTFDSVGNIAHTVEDINDLVSQTNILALNASVEAARAGEHGQGFGVVAKEVGRLAEQTRETADGIRDTAESSISEAENALNRVDAMTPMIERIAGLMNEITAASVEQNSGVTQVNSAINELNSATQKNAAGAERIAANVSNLRNLVDELNSAVRAFKV